MIELCKIVHTICDPGVSPNLISNYTPITRGNTIKLHNQSFHYDTRKYFFSADIVKV